MALIETILSQYLDDHSQYCGEETISSVIGIELPKTVQARFSELCRIAFDTVCRQELIFTNKTMPEALHDLGFTDSVPGLYMRRTCSYNFLHLSIQEFLAAYHVSLLSLQEQEQLLLRSREEYHFRNMMRFIAGLTKFEGIRKEAIQQVIILVGQSTCLDYYSLELLYECQNVSVLDKEDTYTINSSWWTSHHWFAVGYCIANSKCAWELSLGYTHMDVQSLVHGLQDCKTQPAYTIKTTTFINNDNFYALLLLAPDYFTTLIEGIIFEITDILTHFCQWLPASHLKTLSLHGLQPDNIEMVLGALTAVPSLKTLDMRRSKFTLQHMQDFASMLQQSQSLTKLDISRCNIDFDRVCYLTGVLHSNTTLTEMSIYGNSIGGMGGLAMAEMLEHNTTLTVLNIGSNSVGESGALAIAEILKHNTTLTVLNISYNYVGERGALAIAEMLKHNTTLIVLNMSQNYVGERVALAMADMLKHNTTLTALDMSHNSVGKRGALAMAEMLKHNTTLEKLDMIDDTIGDEGAKALVESLAVNHHLKKLHINSLDCPEDIPAYHANMDRIIFLTDYIHNSMEEQIQIADTGVRYIAKAQLNSLAVNYQATP